MHTKCELSHYQRWLIALERILIENDLVTKQEIEKQTEEMLQDGK